MSTKYPKGLLRRLYRHVSPRRRYQLGLLVMLIVCGAVAELASLGAVLPFLSVMAGDGAALQAHADTSFFGFRLQGEGLFSATLTFACVAVVAAALRVLIVWASNHLMFMLGFDWGVSIYQRTLSQPYVFFVSHHTSQIIAGVNNIQQLVGGILMPLIQLVIAAITAAFILAALLEVDAGTATVAGLGFTGIYLVVSLLMRRKLRTNSRIIAKAQAQRIQSVQEGMGSIRNVIIDHTRDVYVRKFAITDGALREAQATNMFISISPRYLIEAAGMVLIATLAYGLSLKSGHVSAALPVLGTLALGAQKLLPLLNQVYQGWTKVAGGMGLAEDVLALLEMPVPDQAHTREPMPFREAITLDGVFFRYQDEAPWILKDMSLTIPRGARCGIIGTTGGGKSTTVDLIMGLLEPTRGQICIDGVPLDATKRKSWQARIAHVPQVIYLSDTTIAENIALGVEPNQIDEVRVRRAAKQAQISAFIEGLPTGYQTMVGEQGVRLSGGQRQRIAIARALYKQADVLILDEATSALDDATERAVIDCIEELEKDMTIVLIAHRLSTVRMCDILVKLEAGSIVAEGSYESIISAHA